jgi:hypothetical protein
VTKDDFLIGNWIYWPVTDLNYSSLLHCCWVSHYKALHTNLFSLSPLVFTDLYHRNCKSLPKSQTPIQLHYSTYEVFKSHVRSPQPGFLYSSSLLKLTACLLAVFLEFTAFLLAVFLELTACLFACLFVCFCRYNSLVTRNCPERILSLTYIAAERTCTYNKHIDRYPASLLARQSDLQKSQLPLLLRVRPCLQSCCLATRWSNPLKYIMIVGHEYLYVG